VQDAEKIGGAEISNKTIIKAGRELGHSIKVITPQEFHMEPLLEADVIVLNGFYAFSDSQLQTLYYAMYEKQIPYVRYEHDHREISEGDMRQLSRKPFIGFPRRLFTRSLLNIFISPLHFQEFVKALGPDIEEHPYFMLPPAVDPRHFYFRGGERNPKLVVNTTGQLLQRKGLIEVVSFARANTQFEIEVYTTKRWNNIIEMLNTVHNIKVCDPVSYDELPTVYSRAVATIHFPEFFEDCGRTPIEGALCGNKILSNKATGAMHFGFWEKFGKIKWFGEKDWYCEATINDLDGFSDYLLQGHYSFWREIERRL